MSATLPVISRNREMDLLLPSSFRHPIHKQVLTIRTDEHVSELLSLLAYPKSSIRKRKVTTAGERF